MRDDVDLRVWQRLDRVGERLGAIRHGARARNANRVRVTAERREVPRDTAEVVDLRAGQPDLIEAHQAVDQDHREWRRALAAPDRGSAPSSPRSRDHDPGRDRGRRHEHDQQQPLERGHRLTVGRRRA
jgi:hypothetical protein